ncbi:MAG: hypothetical protein ACRCUJ_01150 [Phocaeicola sp.]
MKRILVVVVGWAEIEWRSDGMDGDWLGGNDGVNRNWARGVLCKKREQNRFAPSLIT